MDAVDAYLAGTSTLEARGGINTPNFWEHVSIPRVDWTYLVTGLTGSLGSAARRSSPVPRSRFSLSSRVCATRSRLH